MVTRQQLINAQFSPIAEKTTYTISIWKKNDTLFAYNGTDLFRFGDVGEIYTSPCSMLMLLEFINLMRTLIINVGGLSGALKTELNSRLTTIVDITMVQNLAAYGIK